MPKKTVTRIFQKAFWSIDRKSLARRTTNKNIKLAGFQIERMTQSSGIDLFNRAVVSNGFWMVGTECFHSPMFYVVSVQAFESSTAKTFSDTPRATEQIERCIWKRR